MAFSDVITYSRAGGATRVNSSNKLVGVDFSVTSNTIGTGSKTFTLSIAAAGNDRDWPAGSSVIAVSQAGATGSMTGTVTSYNPTTQSLVINVTNISGSGTSTNWRIGSTEPRAGLFQTYDATSLTGKGITAERQSSNLLLNSVDLTGTSWSPASISVTKLPAFYQGNDAFRLLKTDTTSSRSFSQTIGTSVVGNRYCFMIALFADVSDKVEIGIGTISDGLGVWGDNNSSTGFKISGPGVMVRNTGSFFQITSLSPTIPTWVYVTRKYIGAVAFGAYIYPDTAASTTVGNGITVMYPQVELGESPTSYIPTTTVSATRPSDFGKVDGANFSKFYNVREGTFIVEFEGKTNITNRTIFSVDNGTMNESICLINKQSGTYLNLSDITTNGTIDIIGINLLAQGTNYLSHDGLNYRINNTGSNASINGSAFADSNKLMTVGATESFFSSDDAGVTFTPRYLGQTLTDGWYANGKFVIGSSSSDVVPGMGAVRVSTDGISWRRVNTSAIAQQLNDVTYGGTTWVAVGNAGAIITSTDAETWTARTSGTASSITGVHFDNSLYVSTINTTSATLNIRTSSDGTTWTARNSNVSLGLMDVFYGNSLWVAVGNTGAISTSTDGITWTSRTSNVSTNLLGVMYADGLWVAVGNTGTVTTSPDGINWTNRTATSGTTSNLTRVSFFNGKFYWVGATTNIGENTAANIVAGTTWTVRATGTTGDLAGVVASGSRIVFTGSSGTIISSDDGATYNVRSGNNATLNGVAYGNGTWVLGGAAVNGSGLLSTVHPTTYAYTRRVSGVTGAINDVNFVENAFYAPHSLGILKSVDGITWTAVPGISVSMFSVTYGTSGYVGVGSTGRYTFSADGVTWSQSASSALGTSLQYNGVAYKSGMYVAVGSTGSISTSTNGTTWTTRTSGVTSNLLDVMYSDRDSLWYIVGDAGTILRSPNGITWTTVGNDAVVGVGSAGAITSNIPFGKILPNQNNKVAFAYSQNGIRFCINGADVVVDSSVVLPAVDRFTIGSNGDQSIFLDGCIKSIKYEPRILPDSLMKTLTT